MCSVLYRSLVLYYTKFSNNKNQGNIYHDMSKLSLNVSSFMIAEEVDWNFSLLVISLSSELQ